MAGLPLLAAVSAPSTLAAELAEEAGHDAGRLPARPNHERLHRRAARDSLTGPLRLPSVPDETLSTSRPEPRRAT